VSNLFSRRSFIRSSALTVGTTLLAASCNRTQTNSANSSPSPSGSPIRLGFNLWPGAIPWQIAEDKGFLKTSGVNAEITWFQVLGDQIDISENYQNCFVTSF